MFIMYAYCAKLVIISLSFKPLVEVEIRKFVTFFSLLSYYLIDSQAISSNNIPCVEQKKR